MIMFRFAPHGSGNSVAFCTEFSLRASVITTQLVRDAALRLLDEDAQFRAAMHEGVAAAARGELIDDDQCSVGWRSGDAPDRQG